MAYRFSGVRFEMVKSAKTYISTILIAVWAFTLASCDSFIFEEEGDCSITYKIKFCYDKNLKWADAFPSEVKSVRLYAFDSHGVFVKDFSAKGEILAKPDYYMNLDLPAGDYKLVSWCGLENEGTEEESFTVPQPVEGITTIEELTCLLNTKSNGDMECSDTRLYFLYHGYMEVTLPEGQGGQEYEYTMYLTKNTNHIRIILQELSEEEGMNADNYEISIEAANGFMAYDNTLLGNTKVTYTPWSQLATEAGLGKEDVADGSLKYVEGLVADLSVGRMMEEHKDDLMLTIRDSKSQETIIAKVPIIQYALLSKEYYEQAYNHSMSNQEFLDREDEYVLTFFLYKGKWIDSYIYIHSWRVVLHEYGLGT